MMKRNRIRKQLGKIYFKNREQLSRTETLLFNLLIIKMSKKHKKIFMVFILKLLKWLIGLICSDSRPGSFFVTYEFQTNNKSLHISGVTKGP